MSKRKNLAKQKLDKKRQILLLAEMTHQLTGEQESDIRGYLEKFGIQAFFARLDTANVQPHIRTKIYELYQSITKENNSVIQNMKRRQ
jgi:hypothetical protein